MGKRFFRFAVACARLVTKRVETLWEVPFDGEPCVFVCNHERAQGPVRIGTDFPLMDDCKIWIFADPLHRETVPAYVRQDYWWDPNGRLAPLWNRIVPPLVALVLPPALRSVPHVAVYHDIRAVQTMRESLKVLREEKKHLVIFPEIPDGFGSHNATRINEGFLVLLKRYYAQTGKCLKIWPVHFDSAGRQFRVKKPISWDVTRDLEEQVPELCAQIMDGLFEREPGTIPYPTEE